MYCGVKKGMVFPKHQLRVDSHRSAKVTILEDGIPSSPSPSRIQRLIILPQQEECPVLKSSKDQARRNMAPTQPAVSSIIFHANSREPKVSFTGFTENTTNELLMLFLEERQSCPVARISCRRIDHRTDGFKTISSLGNSVGKDAPISKNDITLKLGYEFGEGDYIEFKAGRTDLDADVSYIG